MIYKTLLSLLMVASAAFAASEVQNSNILSAKQDSLESKRGLIVDGNIKGVLVNSYMESDQETESITNRMPNAERSQFVSADIGFHFRPYENIRANLLLRLEAGMQNYFIVILMLSFFAVHESTLFKFLLASIVLAIRIITIFIQIEKEPYVIISGSYILHKYFNVQIG